MARDGMDRRVVLDAMHPGSLLRRALLGTWIALALGSSACFVNPRPGGERWICADGQCRCEEGYADCDGDPSTGCEVDVRRDALHCGRCFQPCANGQCEASTCHCADGYRSCDDLASTGCEVDVRSDSHHCGACELDCEGGACLEGVCQPARFLDLSHPYGLALTSSHAFWTGQGLWSAPLDGSAAPGRLDSNLVYEFTTYGDRVFWLREQSVMSMAPEDESPTLLAQTPLVGSEASIAVNAHHVFWTLRTDSVLYRAPRAGGAPDELATGVRWIAADDSHVYWLDVDQMVYRLPSAGDGGDLELLFAAEPGGWMGRFAADRDDLYWSYQTDGGARGGLRTRPKQGGSTTTLFEQHQFAVRSLVADGGGLYFFAWFGPLTGDISRIDLASHQLTTLASGQIEVSGIAFTGQYAYWMTRTDLMRLVR